MRIVSTTLVGNNESIVEDALRSVVAIADQCVVIDTGVTDRTLELARSVAGSKYVERKLKWTNDFAAARNFALDAATELRADWALTVDSDERLHFGETDVRGALAASRAGVFYVAYQGGSYVKERFFRLPMRERWRGPTHEAFAAYKVGTETLPGAHFTELGKSAEAQRRKFERDVEVLTVHSNANPKDARWFYYLGESHNNLGQHERAVAAYDQCAALRAWDEESAWACYRAAECLCKMNRFVEALDRCTAGLARHAGIAELAWLAGYCCYQLGRDDQAVYWARLALVHGLHVGDGAKVPRIGFRDPPALWENPYDLLRWAEKRRGNESASIEAERFWNEAKAKREGAKR